MTRVVALLAVVAGFGGFAASAAWSSAAAPACGTAGGKTLAHDHDATVYSLGGNVYGCAYATGTAYRLGSSRFCNSSDLVANPVLTDAVAGYSVETCGTDTGSTVVTVRRLTSGLLMHREAVTSRGLPEGYGSAPSIVVKSDGAVAWIGVDNSIVGHSRVIEVHRHDSRGSKLLDASGRLHPASLTLHGSLLRWRDGSSTRHATLH